MAETLIKVQGGDTEYVNPLPAPLFSTANAYSIGNYCTYQGKVYRFTAAKAAGDWDSTKVMTVTNPAADTDTTLSISGMAADAEAVGEKAMLFRDIISSTGSGPDEYTQIGSYYIQQAVATAWASSYGFPISGSGCRMFVLGGGTSMNSVMQVCTVGSSSSPVYYRVHTNDEAWGAWIKMLQMSDVTAITDTALKYMGIISDATSDPNEYTQIGSYYIQQAVATAWASSYGFPISGSGCRMFVLGGGSSLNSILRIATVGSSGAPIYYQVHANGEAWGDWQMACPGGEYGHSLAGGKVLAGIGTSFMRQASSGIALSRQWFSLVAAKYGMTAYNNGLAASSVAKYEGENVISMVERIDTILTPHENTETDAANGTLYPGERVDYFIILGGSNDSSNSVPLGDIDSTNITDFNGALNTIVRKIRSSYPRAKLFMITAFHRRIYDALNRSGNALGLYDEDYANEMVKNARHNGVPVLDAWHDINLIPKYNDNDDEDTYWPWISSSNHHLNVEGNAFVAPIIAKALERI